jgi:hypothetical protein
MESKIILYGERGIINGLLLELFKTDDGVLKFLHSIKEMVTDENILIPDKVLKVVVFNEISLSQFGDTDLIVVAESIDSKKHIFFIEAKIKPYEYTSIHIDKINKKEDMTSKLNLQLGLKYRFAKALEYYINKNSPKKKHRIFHNDMKEQSIFIENEKGFWYDINFYSSYKNGRKINKEEIVDLIENYFIGDNIYYFVALCTTIPIRESFQNYVPLISKKKEDNYNEYETIIKEKYHFCYLTYDCLFDKGLIDYNDENTHFGQAWKLTVNDIKLFITQKPGDISKHLYLLEMAESLINNTKAYHCSFDKGKSLNSSYSIKANGHTVAKLFISFDSKMDYHLYYGLKNKFIIEKNDSIKYLGEKIFYGQLFQWYYFPKLEDQFKKIKDFSIDEDVLSFIKESIEQLRDNNV